MTIETNLKDECVRILSEPLPALSGVVLPPRADNLAFQAANKLVQLGVFALHRYGTPSREPKDTERPEAPEQSAAEVWAAAVLDPEEPTYNGWPVAPYFGSWRDARFYIEGTREGDKWRFRVNIALGLAVELGWRP